MFMCFVGMLLIYCLFCFFFFKQKTAYEMRISDWSSDVCSSDLDQRGEFRIEVPRHFGRIDEMLVFEASEPAEAIADDDAAPHRLRPVLAAAVKEIGRASCRERVCQYV